MDEKTVEKMIEVGNTETDESKEAGYIVYMSELVKNKINEIEKIAQQYEDEYWELPKMVTPAELFSEENTIAILKNRNEDQEAINRIAKILLKHDYRNEADLYAVYYVEHKRLLKLDKEFKSKYNYDPCEGLKRFRTKEYD